MVYYYPEGELYQISPYSSSQVRQLLSAERYEQLEVEESRFFEEILSDLTRLLGRRLADAVGVGSEPSHRSLEGRSVVNLVPSGILIISRKERMLEADGDGIVWLKRVFQGKLVFVLDALLRGRQ